ncbi:hypothetical protein T10_4191 [Trichinella papuae]|uniref:Uncharacterized protein n=1 Tax=Trichinella papuae TaxID=268474 RepID=A0A0V1N8V8_9BILA|nr:hypothetical protein T10_4191 [Trichinella papuae]
MRFFNSLLYLSYYYYYFRKLSCFLKLLENNKRLNSRVLKASKLNYCFKKRERERAIFARVLKKELREESVIEALSYGKICVSVDTLKLRLLSDAGTSFLPSWLKMLK